MEQSAQTNQPNEAEKEAFQIYTNVVLNLKFKDRMRVLVFGKIMVHQDIWLDTPSKPLKAETKMEIKKIFWRLIQLRLKLKKNGGHNGNKK